MNSSRRRLILQSTATLAVTSFTLSESTAATPKPSNKICLFEKPVQEISFEELAVFASRLGFDGISATIRKGDHNLPERVDEELPRLVDALTKHKLEITELTVHASFAFIKQVKSFPPTIGAQALLGGNSIVIPENPYFVQLIHEWMHTRGIQHRGHSENPATDGMSTNTTADVAFMHFTSSGPMINRLERSKL